MGKRHKPEEIIAKLRQVEVMTGQGTTIADAIRSIGVLNARDDPPNISIVSISSPPAQVLRVDFTERKRQPGAVQPDSN